LVSSPDTVACRCDRRATAAIDAEAGGRFCTTDNPRLARPSICVTMAADACFD